MHAKEIVCGILAIQFVSVASVQAKSKYPFPEKVRCAVQGKSRQFPRTIVISDLNTDSPESDLEDAPLSNLSVSVTQMKLFFSNECDNGFDIVFRPQDLVYLATGDATSVRGTIKGRFQSCRRSPDLPQIAMHKRKSSFPPPTVNPLTRLSHHFKPMGRNQGIPDGVFQTYQNGVLVKQTTYKNGRLVKPL